MYLLNATPSKLQRSYPAEGTEYIDLILDHLDLTAEIYQGSGEDVERRAALELRAAVAAYASNPLNINHLGNYGIYEFIHKEARMLEQKRVLISRSWSERAQRLAREAQVYREVDREAEYLLHRLRGSSSELLKISQRVEAINQKIEMDRAAGIIARGI